MICVHHFYVLPPWRIKLKLEFISSQSYSLVPDSFLRSMSFDRTCMRSWSLRNCLLPFLFFPALIKAFIDGEIIGTGTILDKVWKEHLNSLLYSVFELVSKKRIAITLYMTTKFLFGNCLKEFNSEDTKMSADS